MRQENRTRIDDNAHQRFRALWLAFSFFVSVLWLGCSLIGSWREVLLTNWPLDVVFAACALSVAGISSFMRPVPPCLRTSFMIGWVHACTLLYVAFCVVFLSYGLFLRGIGNPWANGETPDRDWSLEYLQTVFTAMTRGVAVYFISVAGLYVSCRDRKGIALPAVEFVSVLFFILYLALNLGLGWYH